MNAPASAISPPRTQTPRISVGVCTCRATTEGLMKMPAPMIPPITTIVAWNSPNCRASLGRTGLGRGEVWFSVENILGCESGRDARVLYHSRRADSSQHAGGSISPQELQHLRCCRRGYRGEIVGLVSLLRRRHAHKMQKPIGIYGARE